jgi:ribosomal protein S18 acetylase RimI-like enzyme
MIRLVPMLESELNAYLEKSIPNYAADNVEAGYWSEEEALERSRKVFNDLLPEGVKSKGQHLFQVEDVETNERVGIIWLNARTDVPRPSGFIYDIEMGEKFRGKGFGKQTMLAIEEKARELGLKSIGLHVFAHNAVAKGLYEKIGYEVTSLNMVKELD